MYDLIVIGGGPAGLTATMYAIRKHLDVLMITKDLGGKTNYHLDLPWVHDYQVIRGLEVVSKFRSELEYLEFARFIDDVEKVVRADNGPGFVVLTKGGSRLETRAVIVATGARQKRLDVPGERQYIMRGLCYSALSYAPLFIDRTVAVVGDGELALRSAAELAIIAQQVYLVMDETAILDSTLGRKLQAADNVQIMTGYHVLAVEGEPMLATHAAGGNGHSETETAYARSLSLQDSAGRVTTLTVDGTFVELGLVPNTHMVAGLVDLDPQGRIYIDCGNRSSEPGIFAAGDATTVCGEQVLIAVGEGAKAALSAYDFLLPSL